MPIFICKTIAIRRNLHCTEYVLLKGVLQYIVVLPYCYSTNHNYGAYIDVIQPTLDISNSDSSNSAKFEASFCIKNTFRSLSLKFGAGDFLASLNYSNCKLMCTLGNLNLKKNSPISFEIFIQYWSLLN